MSAHLYHVGDVVSLNFHQGQFFSKLNPFKVEAQLPHLGTMLQYRIKSGYEECQRVVAEDQISTYGSQPKTAPVIVLRSELAQAEAATMREVRIS